MALSIGELTGYVDLDDRPFEQGVTRTEGRFRGLGSRLGAAGRAMGATAGIAVGLGVSSGAASAAEFGQVTGKLGAQLGQTGPEAAMYGEIASNLYASAWAQNMPQAGEAVRSVVTNIRSMAGASQGDIEGVSQQALILANTFEQDVGGATRAVDKMIQTGLVQNAGQGFDVLTAGFQRGADNAGDLLDTMSEYSTMFREVGLSGEQAMGLIQQGLAAGARDADTVADSIKEFSIRAVDGSKSTVEGFQAVGLNAGQMAAEIAKGGPSAANALDLTLDRLRAMPDPVQRGQAAVALFGTKAEDLGEALYSLDPSAAVSALGDVAGATQRAGDQMQSTGTAAIDRMRQSVQAWAGELAASSGPIGIAAAAITQFGGTALGLLAPLAMMVASQRQASAAARMNAASQATSAATTSTSWVRAAATTVASWAMMAGRATASAARVAAAWLISNGAAAAGAVARMTVTAALMVAKWAVMAAGAMARAAIMAAAWLIGMGPVGWVIAAVVGLVALIIANWDTVVSWTRTAWDAVGGAVEAAWQWVRDLVMQGVRWVLERVADLMVLRARIRAAWDGAVQSTRDRIAALVEWARGLPRRVLTALGDLGRLLLGAGRDLVTGLWNGISGGWRWLTDMVSRLATNLLNAARRALGIASPSKRFRDDVGRWVGRGLAVGLDGEHRHVMAAGTRLGDAATLGARRSRIVGLPGPTSGMTSGLDAAAIEDAVRSGMFSAMDRARLDVDGRGVAQLVHAVDAGDSRRGGGLVGTRGKGTR